MERICVGGNLVPAPLAAAFRSRENTPFREERPFSYSHPNPGGPKLPERLDVPKVLPIVPSEMSAQAVHLQYNSPMGLYNQETAQEQFQQQIGGASQVPLPAPDKHFDPNKSATLRYIKEGDHSNFGANFDQKIAAAEAPNVPYQQEPTWARYAREKSERARSRTPADPSQREFYGSRSPSQQYRSHHEMPWEHAEKTKTYTNAVYPPNQGPAYYQYQYPGHRSRPHSAGPYPEKGYECGGMDFTKGLPIEKAPIGGYETHVSRKEEWRATPGYEMGGTDFGKGYVAPGPYHGHGPDPPRLRPKYTANPHDACNSYVAPNVDDVNANLLVGDTLSNQKIRHEVRHIDQSEFGTTFAPPGGFKRDHITVRKTPPPQEPVIFSTDFAGRVRNRSASLPRQHHHYQNYQSSQPTEQTNVWRQRQADTDREIYQTEPNWSQTVQQRKGAWERKVFDTEARINLPASAKVPAAAPPAWQQTAQQKHQVWQNVADSMQGGREQQQSYQTHHTSSQSYSNPQPFSYSTTNNAMNIANSGFNQNQLDYITSHQNNYTAGQQYSPRQQNNSYSTTTTTVYPGGTGYNQDYVSSKYSHRSEETIQQPSPMIPCSKFFDERKVESKEQLGSNQERVHEIKLSPVPSTENRQDFHREETKTLQSSVPIQTGYQEYSSSKYSHRKEETTEQISPGIRAGTFTVDGSTPRKEESLKSDGRVHQIKTLGSPHSQSSYQESFAKGRTDQGEYQEHRSHYKSSSSTREERSIPVQTGYQESNYHKSSNSTQETRTVPVQPAQSQQQYHYNKTSSHETTTAPVQPIQTNFQESYHKSSSSNQQQEIKQTPRYETGLLQTQGNQMLHSPGSYKSFHSSHYSKQETTTNTNGPEQYNPQVTTITPVTKSTSYSYSAQSNSNPQQPAQIQQSSTTSETQRQAIPLGYAPPTTGGGGSSYQSHHSYKREEQESRPVSQLSQYSQSSYNRKREERTETRTVPAPTIAPLTSSSAAANQNQTAYSKIEMNETLPKGSVANTHSNTQGGYRDQEGHDVFYKRDLQTTTDPGKDISLLKEEEKRVVETPLEPGVISRHVTTKYYKKKTVTDTTTTTTPETH